MDIHPRSTLKHYLIKKSNFFNKSQIIRYVYVSVERQHKGINLIMLTNNIAYIIVSFNFKICLEGEGV